MLLFLQFIKHNFFKIAAPIILINLLISCSKKKEQTYSSFEVVEASKTGIGFKNILKPTNELNLLTYMYYYNGAGIGAGDFNNDGLIDLFFCANQDDNKLFLNKGQLKFKDVTKEANIPNAKDWNTGVSVVDINNDGLLDIYISKVGHYKTLQSKNQLLICQGLTKDSIPTFKDEAEKYGLDFSGFGTQAAFFDFDLDGDLDVFLLNHSVNHDGNFAPRNVFENTYDSLAGQKFFRNDVTMVEGKKQVHFTNITKESGIHGSKIGYGLGVAVADINMDGYPDFYVGNDFHENDYLYINQKNGTFKDISTTALNHTSMFSMGVDVADINNDANPEIISADMLPYNPTMYKRSLAEDDYTIYMQKINYGYSYQYARNNLQYNNGNGTFSEIGQYAGVYKTDWSWATLWMDYNNDGLKDLFVSNGIPKRMNDIDYVNFISDQNIQAALNANGIDSKGMEMINKFPEIKLENQLFENKGKEKFENISNSINNNPLTFSNGSVYCDLDNDGDLDMVTNNINDAVTLYKNKTNDDTIKTFTKVSLLGQENNIKAIGAKVFVFSNNQIQTYENYPVHGFQSSMLEPILIGLNKIKIDSVFLVWPDNSFEKINLQLNKINQFSFKNNLPKFDYTILHKTNNTFQVNDITASTNLLYTHTENNFNAFDREPLIPFVQSTEGPALAVADINGDGLEDVFVGASKGFHNAIFLQNSNGQFERTVQQSMLQDSLWENTNAIWTDVNGDKFPDLIVASGGNEFYNFEEHTMPLLYINDSKGNMTRKKDAFASIFQTQSVIVANDINGDGFMDLFIGCNVEPWNYGKKVNSFLLQNDGTGKFTDVTKALSPDLLNANMVTNAYWVDVDNDKNLDLVTCSNWGTINAYIKKNKQYNLMVLGPEKGLWNFAMPCDVDGNGLPDFIAGNFGTNNKMNVSKEEPANLYYNDFDGNGKQEQIVTYYLNHEEIPLSSKMEIEKRLPYIKKKFLYAADYAKASVNEMFGKKQLAKAEKNTIDYLNSAIVVNKGNGKFETIALPEKVQWSTIKAAVIIDINKDGLEDYFIAGNFYENNIQLGKMDANYGLILFNKGNAKLEALPLSNFNITGQVRNIKPIKIKNNTAFILAKNKDALQVIQFGN